MELDVMRTKPETGDRHPAPSSPGRASQHRLCGWAMGAPGLFHQHLCAKDQRLPGLGQVSPGLCNRKMSPRQSGGGALRPWRRTCWV